MSSSGVPEVESDVLRSYQLTDQIGHLMRRAVQRHTAIFANKMGADLTPTRFAALVMLFERGDLSQNELGRLTAMDIATIKGVVDRLQAKGFVTNRVDPNDGRRKIISLTQAGSKRLAEAIPKGIEITNETLEPLGRKETNLLLKLMRKISY